MNRGESRSHCPVAECGAGDVPLNSRFEGFRFRATHIKHRTGRRPDPKGVSLIVVQKRSAISIRSLITVPLLCTIGIATALSSTLMFAYWGLFNWVPAYLSSPRENGGAGMSIVQSVSWIVPMQTGAFLGYTCFGFLADRFGRRPTFLGFVLCAALCVPVYGLFATSPTILLLTGPLVGFFGHGYFSVFGAMLAELFPTGIRATAQGFCYNTGRGISALAPMTIGAIAGRNGIGIALACTSVFIWLAPC